MFLEHFIVHSMVERDGLVLAETDQGSKALELGYRLQRYSSCKFQSVQKLWWFDFVQGGLYFSICVPPKFNSLC